MTNQPEPARRKMAQVKKTQPKKTQPKTQLKTTWRDIADQLTPAEVALLEWLERHGPAGLLAEPEQHLMLARGWASENLEQLLLADVAPPPEAVEVAPWRRNAAGERRRDYTAAETGVAGRDITLEVRGSQHTDGRVDGRIGLTGDGLGDLDPTAARQLAAALLAAADRIEGRTDGR